MEKIELSLKIPHILSPIKVIIPLTKKDGILKKQEK